ncbi:MAG: AAA family ATPase [Syntrophotaleaceae bacterium]
MVDVPRFTLQKILLKNDQFALWRGTRNRDLLPVLIKVPVSFPRQEIDERLQHEYALRRELESNWAAKPLALVRKNGGKVLVFEDLGGEPLERLLGSPLDLGRFLPIAISLADAVSQVHAHGMIHKDLRPSNIFIDGADQVRLIGFGLASRLPRERPTPEPPEVIAGTLAYMAPEQTGRMNRSVDSRADLYSLGVIFYEMLTGALPCVAADLLEWVHCHVARQPISLAERSPELPPAVSAIVMKLLAKTVEERYRTAAGVAADLRRCHSEWQAKGTIEPFPLGERDVSPRLLIPEKLYGRSREVRALLESFERVVAGSTPELTLISGFAGIGKSSVVNELKQIIVSRRGWFSSGKFDQYKHDIPYAPLAQALRQLVRQLLLKSDAELDVWRTEILKALHPNGRLVVDLIPELELITGKQPPVPDLGPREAENRFLGVLARFLEVFAGQDHPLVLFLDDLQWLDRGTLKFLEYLFTYSDIKYLLAIGAYRDNEVGPDHPLAVTLEAIRRSGAPLQETVLRPLSVDDLGQLLADTLQCKPPRNEPLARLVHAKTAGNPFFVEQFLEALYQERCLDFDKDTLTWRWDLEKIRKKGFTENVVDFLAERLTTLPAATQNILRTAACLGSSFGIPLLALACGKSGDKTLADFWPAIRDGFVLRYDDKFAFAHDRIQQAAYSLIPGPQLPELHLRIGTLLLEQTSPEDLAEKIFEIVSQFNLGTVLISSAWERERVAELNLLAGRRAKASGDFASGLQYLAAGRALLAEDAWERRYDLVFPLELSRAECEYLTGKTTEAEKRLSMLSHKAVNIVDAAAVASVQAALYTTLDRSDFAVEACLKFLRRLNIEWSPHPAEEAVDEEYRLLWRRLGSRRIEELIDLPAMNEPDWNATLDVLSWASSPALFTDHNLFCLIAGRMVNLSLEHGNGDASGFGYIRLGMVLGPRFGDYQSGFRFGKLGLDLLEKRGPRRFMARTYLNFGHLINPWTKHLRSGVHWLRQGARVAQETGDLTYACYIRNCLITLLLAAGEPLGEVERQAEAALAFVRKARFGLVVDIMTGQLRLIRVLRGLMPDFSSFDDEGFNEENFERHLEADPRLAIASCWYWIRKLQGRFFAGDYPSAVDAAARADRLLWTSPSFFETAEYHFFAALAHSACCESAPGVDRSRHLQAAVEHHEQLQIWAENCPANFGNREALVAAEIARLNNRDGEAMQLYEKAIRSSSGSGFVQNAGLAYELAAGFYRTRGFDLIADAYLREAVTCYAVWGAEGKVKQLEGKHPGLFRTRGAPPTGTFAMHPDQLDLLSVMKASQAVSGEIVLEKLIETLMTIVLQHAGAERALLILPQGEEYRVEAEAVTGPGKGVIISRPPAVIPAQMPELIVRYVLRTQEKLILDDASSPNFFSADEYLRRSNSRSLLCVPLLRQKRLAGILYLENNLTPGVFTAGRVAVLELIASQAAISLENAVLYGDLQRENRERRRAEEAVRESQSLLQSIIDNSMAVIYVKDLQGRYLLVNRQFEKVFHVNRQSVAGCTDYDLFSPDHAATYRVFDQQVVALGTPLQAEEEVPHDDGMHTYISIKTPVLDKSGNVYAVCGISTDITERMLLDRLKNEFISTAAHELRTPLTIVMGYLELVMNREEPVSDEDRRNYLEIAYRHSEALAKIVEDLLDLSRVHAGRLISLNRSRQDLAALLERSASTWRGLSPRHDFTLHLPRTPIELSLDPDKIYQVLDNLVSNAVKFSPRGGKIRMKGEFLEGIFQVTVEDEGIGMHPEQVAHIFDKFYRADASDTAAVRGLGLGMSIVKQIVEGHGGRIWVESEVGRGTRVHFALPTDEGDREGGSPRERPDK